VPKYLRARAPHDDSEARKIRRLAGARHAPADWIEQARIITLSWDGLGSRPGAMDTGHPEPGCPGSRDPGGPQPGPADLARREGALAADSQLGD